MDSTASPDSLEKKSLEDALKRITIELLQAHRGGNHDLVRFYARQAGLPAGVDHKPGRIFAQAIQVYHPDRLEALWTAIQSARRAGNGAELARLVHMLTPKGLHRKTGPSFEDMDLVFDFAAQPSDWGFGESSWEDHLEEELRHEAVRPRSPGIGFREALRREYFGNLDLDISPLELEELDGELVLSDYGIESLAGIGVCRHLTSLTLSCNRIWDVAPLARLRRLEYLDLGANEIEDADVIASLKRLKELDLSDNPLEDLSFLNELPALEYVNLSGVPLGRRGHEVVHGLKARGVLVV